LYHVVAFAANKDVLLGLRLLLVVWVLVWTHSSSACRWTKC